MLITADGSMGYGLRRVRPDRMLSPLKNEVWFNVFQRAGAARNNGVAGDCGGSGMGGQWHQWYRRVKRGGRNFIN